MQVREHYNLDYMRNVIGIIQSLTEEGAVGVLDFLTFRLHTHSGNAYVVKSSFVNDFDNDDFNNAYCEVSVVQE